MNDIEKAIEALKMENELMQFNPMTGEDYPIELQNQDNQDLYNANLTAISALEKQLNGGWVPVNVKLPERDSNCLVTTENGEIFTSKFYGYGEECQGFKEFPEGVWEIDAYGEIVIAWQPSPEPWKEGISDGKDYLQG